MTYHNQPHIDPALILTFLAFSAVLGIIGVIGWWMLFEKAGKPGWASLVPLYNLWVMLEIVEKPSWIALLLCIPLVNVFVALYLLILPFELARVFGKDTAFGLGLLFLNPIFLLILAFGDARYIGNGGSAPPHPQQIAPSGDWGAHNVSSGWQQQQTWGQESAPTQQWGQAAPQQSWGQAAPQQQWGHGAPAAPQQQWGQAAPQQSWGQAAPAAFQPTAAASGWSGPSAASQNTGVTFCPNCGRQHSAGEGFCAGCGTALT